MPKPALAILASLVFSLLTTAAAAASTPLSLQECYTAALKRSEVIATQVELINQAEETYKQARGNLLPTINGVGSYTRLDTPPGQSTAFTRPDRPEVRITGTQPLFRGFREFAALRQTARQGDVARQSKASAETQLYLDVATAFYNVLSLEQELSDLSTEIELNKKRVGELQERRRIGRSRPSEVLLVQSTAAALEAQAASLRGQIAAAREALAFLTGHTADLALNDNEKLPSKIAGLDSYLAKTEARPDVRGAKAQLSATEESIAVARGGHLPSVDFTGNYYLKRVGILENQKWDFTLTGTLPIFAGGTIQSGLRQAVSQNRQSELAVDRARRQGEQEIRSAYKQVLSDQEQVEELGRAAKLAESSYNIQNREYRLGLVTNIEVIQALANYQATQRAFDRARYALKLDVARLEVAASLRPGNTTGE